MRLIKKLHLDKLIKLIIILLTIVGIYYLIVPPQSKVNNDGTLFNWNPSQDPLLATSKNITDSTTCRFKKSFNTFYQQVFTNSNPNPPKSISYVYGDDNEADTVTFINLNTTQPIVRINTGQYKLQVLNDNSESISLINLEGIDKTSHGFSTYKILKHEGILIYTDSFDNIVLGGPTGTLEMGYCN